MLVFFKDGRSVWFEEARGSEEEGHSLFVMGPRNRRIAEVRLDHIAFWTYDNEEFTTYGYAEKADPKP